MINLCMCTAWYTHMSWLILNGQFTCLLEGDKIHASESCPVSMSEDVIYNGAFICLFLNQWRAFRALDYHKK